MICVYSHEARKGYEKALQTYLKKAVISETRSGGNDWVMVKITGFC